MRDLMKNLAALIKVKTIVTLVVVMVFAVLALKESIPGGDVVTVLGMVMAFYFGREKEK